MFLCFRKYVRILNLVSHTYGKYISTPTTFLIDTDCCRVARIKLPLPHVGSKIKSKSSL